MNKDLKQGLRVGGLCVFTYLVSYVIRNMLSVFTPVILQGGVYTKEMIGVFTSVYCIVYACGQLLNGIIGDYVKPKYMVLLGCVISGGTMILFSLSEIFILSIIIYAFTGFGLSMLRGPLVKVISENCEQKHARIACVFFSAVGFVGPFVAGFFALFCGYKSAFIIIGAIAVAIGIFAWFILTVFERKGIVSKTVKVREKKGTKEGNFFALFKLENFSVYLIVCMIVEIAGTAISFWIPTYLNEYLGFETGVSGMITSIISFARALCPFICIGLLYLFKNRDMLTMRVMFFVGTIFLVVLSFLPDMGWLNIVVLILGLMSISCSSAVIWSVYIPSLGKTGRVSSVNGILDASGYFAASIANIFIASSIDKIGWNNTILSWAGIIFAGVIVTFFAKKKKVETDVEQ